LVCSLERKETNEEIQGGHGVMRERRFGIRISTQGRVWKALFSAAFCEAKMEGGRHQRTVGSLMQHR